VSAQGRSLLGQIERVPLDSLIQHPDNPRRGNVQAIAESLDANQQYEPLVVQLSTGRVLAGNHRLQAAQSLGWDSIDVVNVDVDDEHALRILLSANRTADLATYDNQALVEQLQALTSFVGTGYTDDDLDEILDRLREEQAEQERLLNLANREDVVPDPPAEARSVAGEIYALGPHRIMCGDSTDTKQIAALMDGAQASMLFTDPPYGVSYAAKNEFLNSYDKGNHVQSEIENDHQTPEQMSAFWTEAFTAIRPHVAKGGAYYVTGPQGGDLLLLLLLLLALRDSGFPLRHMLIWAKNNHVLGRSDYHYKHEPLIYGWVDGSHKFYGPPGETSLWEIARPHESKLHSTMKPVELMERALTNSSKPGDSVLDPFAGSGSTIIAAEQTGRVCYACEIDSRYVDVIRQRYSEYTGQPELAP
jgi:DNA modification methylase